MSENNAIRIYYLPDEKEIIAEPDQTILQISLKNRIPHTHICFGEGQCSTCRVEILEGIENISPKNLLEQQLSRKKGWQENIRLACQTIPSGDIKIRRLILDEYDAQIAQEEQSSLPQGILQEVVILFLDIQDFTSFTEKELPYDVVFSLNRYYNRVGDIILTFHGFIDKYIGDSIMAIFGLQKDIPTVEFCLDAIFCALKIKEITHTFNQYLKKNFNSQFQIRMGIAYGKAILGMIGHRKKPQYTAIGNVVNLASRLENANKNTHTEILISDSLYQILKNKIKVQKRFKLKLQGFRNIQIAYDLKELIESERNKRENTYHHLFQESSLIKKEASENQPTPIEMSETSHLLLLEIDKQHSQIIFQIQHLSTEITGYVKDFTAEFFFNPEDFTKSKLKLTIPVKQITTFIEARDQHLYSADFFDADKFPNIIFVGSEIVQMEHNMYRIYGNLFLKGISKKIFVELISKGTIEDPSGNQKLLFSGSAVINREEFGIHFNIPLSDNQFVIGKEVKITFHFQCIQPSNS